MLEGVLQLVVPPACLGVGWLLGRYLRKDDMGIKRRESTLHLMEKMRSLGESMDQIDAVLASIDGRRSETATNALSVEEQIEAEEFKAIEQAQSQGENEPARHRSIRTIRPSNE
jgi:hypothetical protein